MKKAIKSFSISPIKQKKESVNFKSELLVLSS